MKLKYLMLLLGVLLQAACSSGPKKTIYSDAMGKQMAYAAYTPPGWTQGEQLPLVLLLHGAKDTQTSLTKYSVDTYFDEKIASGELPRAIVILPYGGLSFWENWRGEGRNYRDWVINDLLSHVKSTYNTLPCPQYCHLTGVSMGGHGALRFAYFSPELFSSVTSISALFLAERDKKEMRFPYNAMLSLLPRTKIWGKYQDDKEVGMDQYHNWVNEKELQDVRLFVTWGTEESHSISAPNRNFHEHLRENQREFSYEVYSGNHNWNDWKYPLAQSLRFHIWGSAPGVTEVNAERNARNQQARESRQALADVF